jgi:hypothetical protein
VIDCRTCGKRFEASRIAEHENEKGVSRPLCFKCCERVEQMWIEHYGAMPEPELKQ